MNIAISTWQNEDCTIGRLTCGDFHCLTLELPWKDNEKNVSCIPAGAYASGFYDSPKHGRVILLDCVRDRKYIEIHAGNYTRQIEGCILVGDSLKYLDSDDILDVTNSKRTLRKLMALLPNRFTIDITRV